MTLNYHFLTINIACLELLLAPASLERYDINKQHFTLFSGDDFLFLEKF